MIIWKFVTKWVWEARASLTSFYHCNIITYVRRRALRETSQRFGWFGMHLFKDDSRLSGHLSHPAQIGFWHSYLHTMKRLPDPLVLANSWVDQVLLSRDIDLYHVQTHPTWSEYPPGYRSWCVVQIYTVNTCQWAYVMGQGYLLLAGRLFHYLNASMT